MDYDALMCELITFGNVKKRTTKENQQLAFVIYNSSYNKCNSCVQGKEEKCDGFCCANILEYLERENEIRSENNGNERSDREIKEI